MRTTSLVAIPLVSVLLLTDLLFAIPLTVQQTTPPAQETQDPSAEPVTMPLWEGQAPGDADSDKPTLTLYAPWTGHRPTPAVIVFPGGSYGFLASNHEGRQMANFLNAMGITAFLGEVPAWPAQLRAHSSFRACLRPAGEARNLSFTWFSPHGARAEARH